MAMEVRRPLKRAMPKLGPPDIYPQDPKQKEDELTSVNVKQGYTSAPLISGPIPLDEYGSAKNANIDAFGVFFSALLSEKHRINTLKDIQKKKQLVNTKEIWYVHAKTKHAVDNWFRDLANGTKSLSQLGKRIPIFNSKEGMFSQLYESHVPLPKAVWFIKMSAVHAIALSESSSKSKKRQLPDQYQEITAALTKYLKEISIRLSEYFQQPQQQQHSQQQNTQQSQQQSSQLQKSQQQSIGAASSAFNNSLSILQQRNDTKPPIAQKTDQLSSTTTTSINSISPLHSGGEEFLTTYNQWQYQTQLAHYLFDEGLLDQYDFLCFLLELVERKRPINDLFVRVICPLLLEYVTEFSRSAVLSRRLAYCCAKKLCQALHHNQGSVKINEPSILASNFASILHQSIGANKFDSRRPDQSSSLWKNSTPSTNSSHLTANSILDIVKSQIIESQNSFAENQENSENSLHKDVIYILSSVIQVICLECPTAMVRHHTIDTKFPHVFKGSPLDQLPCSLSNLPMVESDLNFELRKSIQDSEREILYRSAMVDSKWSCVGSSKTENSKSKQLHRLLTVLDVLDAHNFDKIDTISSVDLLYSRIFPSDQDAHEEQVIKLLCEWATTIHRYGEHRALIVAKLLEKRQAELQDKSQQDDVIHLIFQNLLVQFLDENAPIIEESHNDHIDDKKAFNNLVLLFSELIRCDVFSHYNYMCTLISRGMFNDLSKGTNTDSPLIESAPNSNLNPPGSVKPPRSVGKESDPILGNSIQGLSSNIYPLTVSTSSAPQSSGADLLSSNKLGAGPADQSLRSLGFSPVSSQQNVSQGLDKGHSFMDGHDDVDADLGNILANINKTQDEEPADILLRCDFMSSGSEEKSNTKTSQISKLPPFGLSERSTNLGSTPTSFPPTNSMDSKPILLNQESSSGEKNFRSPSEHRHMTYVKHFPVPDEDHFMPDINQRNILLYGFGKEREDACKAMKKLNKEISKLLSRKALRDINGGGQVKKLASREGGINPEATLHKFEALNHHDRHIITNGISLTVLEMFTGVSNGQTSLLPTLESMSFIFDLFTIASNVSDLLDLIVSVLEELPDVEAQIKLKCPLLSNQYTHSLAVCIIGMLYRYHSCVLLLPKEELCSIFESLQKLVSHLPHPGSCTTSSERVIFYYIYDLYSSQQGTLFDHFASFVQKIYQTLIDAPKPSPSFAQLEWTPTVLIATVNQLRNSQLCCNSSTNPILNASSGDSSIHSFSQINNDITVSIRQQFYLQESQVIRQLNDVPSFRYRFVCDAIYSCATSSYPDLVNDIAVLCADVTARCPALANELLLAFQALCCSSQSNLPYHQLTSKIKLADPQTIENIAILAAILVARRCLHIEEFLIKCAISAILGLALAPVDRQLTEPGVRLTCHILLTLFKDRESPINASKTGLSSSLGTQTFGQTFPNYGSSTPNYQNMNMSSSMGLLQPIGKESDGGFRGTICLKYLCDHHLLRWACCSVKTECHITLLKAIRCLAMRASPSNDVDMQGRMKMENHFDDMNMDCLGGNVKDLDDLDGSLLSYDPKNINLHTASLHQFADTVLRLLCSQKWLHVKCLSDAEIFTTIDPDRNILLDPRIDVKQSQRLLFMICYNKPPEKQADVGLDDQGSDQVASIVKMFESLDIWSMRLSLMRLQFMLAYCKSQSSSMLNDWLDNLAKAVVEFFQKSSQENENQERENNSDESSDNSQKSKSSEAHSSNNSVTNINKIWLIEPLLEKLSKPPSAIQSKIIKASASLMESASVRANSLPSLNQTYLSTAAASTKFKERTLSQRGSGSTNPSNLASTSLLGFYPFLSLLLGCLSNQDKERETLLTSLNSQLYQAIHEKVDDIGYKQSLQDGLELRLCLIGQMFDTIQKSASLTSDWATLLLLLIMNNLVDPQVDYKLYVSVLDMLAMLIHTAYASDPIEQREESKKQYQSLMKKFRKELAALEEKGFIQMKLINPLMPIGRRMTEVITCEPMGSLVDTKGEKVENFYSIDKKKGLKVSELIEVSPWDLIEGHKNPAPLSWPWFGAIRLEQKPLRADENNRLMSWHTHTLRHPTSYFCQTPSSSDGPSSAKRSNSEKKPSQSNPLLKSLIEANDDSLLSKRMDSKNHNTDDEHVSYKDLHDDQFIGREDLMEDYCEMPVDMLFDSTPIETMIEDIKTAMQAEQAAISSRAKAYVPEPPKPIIVTPTSQTPNTILTPVPSEPNRSSTPQVSALSALQNHLNAAGSTEPPLLINSNPGSVPPLPVAMSPMNPRTPEVLPTRPPSNRPKVIPTPPPPSVGPLSNRSMSPMVAISPAIAPTPSPAPKQRAPRKKRTKKDTNANAVPDATIPVNLPVAPMNKNPPQANMLSSPMTAYQPNSNGPMIINQIKQQTPPMHLQQQQHPQQQQQQQHQMLQQQQQQSLPNGGMMIRRGPMMAPQQHQQMPVQAQPQQTPQQQQASVYDFQYQPQSQHTDNRFMGNGPMSGYHYEPQPPQQVASNSMFSGQTVQQHPAPIQQQQQPNQMQPITIQHQPHHAQQQQHQMQAQQQHIQQQQQQQQQPMQHHQMQYQQQHQHGPPPPPLQHQQQIRLAGHHHQQQQAMSFQQSQQQQPQQIFAPQQAAGHSRPALTAMLHQKHAAAGNMDNKMHPQPRMHFG